jgi:DNA helicase II / ATP-dependent DNA helicase PcrA
MQGSELLRGLDDAQREAVTTTASPLAIIAAAGSGKTTVLTRRIAYRASEGTLDPQHVLCLTFTRDAAAEMKRRLRKLGGHVRIEAGTFHGIALQLLRDRTVATHTALPSIANDRNRLLRETLTELRLDLDPYAAGTDIDWMRARCIPPERYEAACRKAPRRSLTPAHRLADIVVAYERLKKRRGVVDFDDLLLRVTETMHRNPDFAAAVHWRYRHFFVDEMQDINPLQFRLLETLRASRPDVCVVGDPRQAIYGWNGADPTLLADLHEQLPELTVISLRNNYRCTPQVVDAARSVLHEAEQSDNSTSPRDDGLPVSMVTHPHETAEANDVAARVRSHLVHRRGADLAVLARTNEQVTELQRALSALGVGTVRSTGTTPLSRTLTGLRRLARDRLAGWLDAHVQSESALERRVCEEIDRYLAADEPGSFGEWIEARRPFDDLDTEPDDAVTVTTFHGAKGCEWWGVWLCGIEEGLVPHAGAQSDAQIAEEARLLYVGMTRAAEHLEVHVAQRRNGAPVRPSRWLQALEESMSAAGTVLTHRAPPPELRSAADPLDALREWRRGIARVSGSPERTVCSDRTLQSLLDDPPTTIDDLAGRLGISTAAAARMKQPPTMRATVT